MGTAHDQRIVVPDASVVLKWIDRLPGEKDREHADALLDSWLNGRAERGVRDGRRNILPQGRPAGRGRPAPGFHPGLRFGMRTDSEVTADRYSRIVVQLKKDGSPIPINDVWIAAPAIHGS